MSADAGYFSRMLIEELILCWAGIIPNIIKMSIMERKPPTIILTTPNILMVFYPFYEKWLTYCSMGKVEKQPNANGTIKYHQQLRLSRT